MDYNFNILRKGDDQSLEIGAMIRSKTFATQAKGLPVILVNDESSKVVRLKDNYQPNLVGFLTSDVDALSSSELLELGLSKPATGMDEAAYVSELKDLQDTLKQILSDAKEICSYYKQHPYGGYTPLAFNELFEQVGESVHKFSVVTDMAPTSINECRRGDSTLPWYKWAIIYMQAQRYLEKKLSNEAVVNNESSSESVEG